MKKHNWIIPVTSGLFGAAGIIAIARWFHPATYSYAVEIVVLTLACISAIIMLMRRSSL